MKRFIVNRLKEDQSDIFKCVKKIKSYPKKLAHYLIGVNIST